jgi:hypothetical protein
MIRKYLLQQFGLVFCLCCFPVIYGVGQSEKATKKSDFLVQPQVRIGKILDNMPDMPDRTVSVFGDINLAWQTTGKQSWNQYYRFPQVGFMISAGSLGNYEILGYTISIVPNLSLPLSKWNRLNIYLLMGTGFAYFSKIYDEIDNPANKLVGTRITNKSIVSLDMNYHLSKHIILTGGFSAAHYSDGHIQLPNFGINIPSFNIGIKYFPGAFPEEFIKQDSVFDYHNKFLFNLRFGIGINELGTTIKPTGGPKYPIYTATAYMTKRLNPIFNLQFGLNYNYYSGYYDFIESQAYYDDNKHFRSSSIIVFTGMEFLIGKFGFTAQLGTYLYNEFYNDLQELRGTPKTWRFYSARYITTRLGAQYYLFNPMVSTKLNPWIGAFLKSNGGAADFPEISLGCAF